MKAWQEDMLHALSVVNNEQELFGIVTAYAHNLGFDNCAYGLCMPIPLTQPKFAIFNNYPVAWQKKYQESGYLAVDPSVQHGLRSVMPVIWSDHLFDTAREFWEEACSFGLTFGWAQPCRNENGIGMLTLARSAQPISDSELKENGLKMAWLAQAAHLKISRLLVHKLLPEAGAKLSDREIEILRWTGDGKTSGEIADILNVTDRTVNFHIGNAMHKLNASNKIVAVVRAAMLGMLS